MQKKISILLFIICCFVSPTAKASTANSTSQEFKSSAIFEGQQPLQVQNFQDGISTDSIFHHYINALNSAKDFQSFNRIFVDRTIKGMESCFENSEHFHFFEFDTSKIPPIQHNGHNIEQRITTNFLWARFYLFEQAEERALSHLREALALSRKMKNSCFIGTCYNLFSQIYIGKGDPGKGVKYALDAISLFRSANNSFNLALTRNRLANIYIKLLEYDKAISVLETNLANKDEWGNDEKVLLELTSSMGMVYFLKKEYSHSLSYQKQLLKLIQQYDMGPYPEIVAYRNMGLTYAEMNGVQSFSNQNKLNSEIADMAQKNPLFVTAMYLHMVDNYQKINGFGQIYDLAKKNKGPALSISLDHNWTNTNFEMVQKGIENGKVSSKIHAMREDSLVMPEGKAYGGETEIPPYLHQAATLQPYLLVLVFGLCVVALIAYLAFNKNRRLRLLLTKKNAIISQQRNEIASSLDIEKNLNNSLNKANASLEQFFSIIAHDLRAPFNVMISYTDILTDNFDSLTKPKIKAYLSTVQKTAYNNYQLTQNLLSWAISQKGGMKVNRQKLNIYEVIDNSINIHKVVAEEKRVRLTNLCLSSLTGNLDKNIVSSVLSNLVNNALKFTPENGEVTINAKKIRSNIVFKIEDSGLGMSKAALRNLFKLNKITSSKGTANESGTGLGLILCKELITKHKGKIKVKSKIGKGTTVLALL
ncbi:MAG: tetratricopeptide repeat-containing sensor histidine kinase [Bacteroidota bacterium]